MGSKKLGQPKPNQYRLITKKEKAVLHLKKSNVSIRGLETGFQLIDGDGSPLQIAQEHIVRLLHFWELPVARWSNTNFLR